MLGLVVHTCNPSTLEAKAGGLWDVGEPWLYNETLSLNNLKTKIVIKDWRCNSRGRAPALQAQSKKKSD
jgi:hypothetical protein